MGDLFLEMKNIHKRFPGVYALKGVQLKIRKGEVHALLGENGAGKSTLMKVLAGIYKQDEGQVFVEGVDQGIINPKKAAEIGLGFVHQELNLAESISVAENVYMGRLPYKNNVLKNIDYKKLYSDTDKLLKKLDVDINPKDIVGDLSTAKKQMVEIVRALSLNAKLIIFDEPSTSLSDKDVKILFDVIRTLKNDGVAIIYISHRLKEIFEICDRVTVLRDGTYINECELSGITENELINMMVGRNLTELFPKQIFEPKEYVLEVENLCDYSNKVKNVSFKARKGEILGIAGLVGAGRTELVRLIFGADPMASGKIKINGKEVSIKSPIDAKKHGICLLTEDRKNQGLSLAMSVVDNMTITNLKSFILNHKSLKETGNKFKKAIEIKIANLDVLAGTLSGGNQQKVVLAKWLNSDSDIFIFDEPTKGIDVGAKSEIYQIMNGLVKDGKIVIIISSELSELLGMADRIYVMSEGKITGELGRKEATQEGIMKLAIAGGVK